MSDQLELLTMCRPGDPETSWQAARLTDRQKGMRRVLDFLTARRGEAFTDHQIAAQIQMDKGSTAKRRKDLERKGLVEFAGEWGTTPNGAPARKWRAV